ncbi:MAG TPA: hypothetical protein VHE30_25190 [Polyangiaceae bacterium]|nr:hypothetical protein [Polyangiaceae bacterium]
MTLPLQRHDQRFTERNTFLFGLLGIVALGRRLRALLEAEEPADAPRDVPLDETAERGVLLLLGILATTERVRAHLDRWASDAPVGAANERSAEPSHPRDLFR